MKTGIDFIIIGAQKSATTSLARYVGSHPAVYMPEEKELDYFSNQERFDRGLEFYLSEYFSRGDASKIWGEASPSYMCDDRVPERIRSVLPHVHLIAILRNPITRALSHYRMACSRGLESRPFHECVSEAIRRRGPRSGSLDAEREFVALGEYGRILTTYRRHFERSQLLILFAEDLNTDAAPEVRKVYRFLGVDEGFRSPILGRRFNVSGDKRFRWLRTVLDKEPVRRLVRSVVPAQRRRQWNYWFITEFATRSSRAPIMEARTRELLRRYFADDVAQLEEAFHVRVPWAEFGR
jgi:hypothetical protein